MGDVGVDFLAAADDGTNPVFPFLPVLDGEAGGVTDLIPGLIAIDVVIAFDHHLLGVIEEADVIDLAFDGALEVELRDAGGDEKAAVEDGEFVEAF